jgi:hypothetical protein
MTMGPFTLFNSANKFIGDGTLDLDTNTIKCMALTSLFTPNAETQSVKANIVANEVANGNGYLTGGVTVACTWIRALKVCTFDSADPAWTGATAPWGLRYLVWYASGTLNGQVDPLIGYKLVDTTPADVTVAVGSTVTFQINAAGLFTTTLP